MYLYHSGTKLSHIKFCGICLYFWLHVHDVFGKKAKKKNLNNLFDRIISLNCFNYIVLELINEMEKKNQKKISLIGPF